MPSYDSFVNLTEYSKIFKFLVGKPVSSLFKNGKQILQKVNFPPAIFTNQFHLWENGCESLKPAWYQI